MAISTQLGTAATSWSNQLGDVFPDPFCDYASTVMPENITDALRWSEYLAINNGIYASAIDRVVSYFVTKLSCVDDDLGDDERKQWDEYLNKTLDALGVLKEMGRNFLAYGNIFVSMVVPFTRHLSCPKCFTEHPLRHIWDNRTTFQYSWSGYKFHAKCQNRRCGYHGPWDRIDRNSTESNDLKVRFWSPHEIDILESPVSKRCTYIWRIPEKVKRMVREGHIHVLEDTNWEIIECIASGENMEFERDVLFHLKEPALAGHDTGGWGISRVLSNFRHAWYVQILHRFNEAIAMDFILPLRLITPPAGQTTDPEGLDPLNSINLGSFASEVRRMIRRRQRHPTEWHTLPFPVQYQALGGEAKQLAPFELIEQSVSLLLNNIGVPYELHKGTLTLQAAPPALRLFESVWQGLVHGMNSVLNFIVKEIARIKSWEPTEYELTKSTVIDDLNDQMAKLQLMQSQMVSSTTGLAAVGLDWKTEMRRILEEQRYTQEQQARLQKEMDSSAMGEQMAAPPQPPQPGQPGDPAAAQGAAPAGPAGAAAMGNATATPIGPNQQLTPQDLMAMAQAEAQKMMQMPEGERQGAMMKMKSANPTLHMAVKQVIEDIQQQARTQGKNMVLQQTYGQKMAKYLGQRAANYQEHDSRNYPPSPFSKRTPAEAP